MIMNLYSAFSILIYSNALYKQVILLVEKKKKKREPIGIFQIRFRRINERLSFH